MDPVPVVFATESARDKSQPIKSTARLLNMYPERGEEGITIRSAVGIKQADTLGQGRVRYMLGTEEGIYANVNGQLVLWNGERTLLGHMPDGETTIAQDKNLISFAAGNAGKLWNGTTLETVSGTPFTDIGSVETISGFTIFTDGNGQFYAWAVDPTNINGLDFASAEYKPDSLVRAMSSGGILWLMGKATIEPWQLTGTADAPFSRLLQTVIEKGLRSVGEAVFLDNTLYFISDEGRVYRIQNYTPQVISTDAITATLEGSTGVSLAYQQRRHDFFVQRLTGAPAVVFDPSTELWWERSTGPCHEEWEVTASCQFDGTWYGGTNKGQLVTFDGHQDLGNELRREATSQNLTQAGRRFTIDALHMRVTGTGTMMLSTSGDGGRSFGNEWQHAFSDGPVMIPALGQYDQFCLKVAVTDNTDFAIHSAGIEIS